MTNRKSIAAGLVMITGIAATGAMSGPGESEPTSDPATNSAMPVRTAPARLVESIERQRIYTGTLVARRRSVLSFERAGKVVELGFDEGQRVEKDQLLARLDTRRLKARRSRAEGDLAQAKALLDELIAGPRLQTIAAAEASVRSLEARQLDAQRNLQRREQLVTTNAISREEYDTSLYAYQSAAAETEVARQNLEELRAGTRAEQIEAQRGQVAALEAALADILIELDDSVLLAPYTGQIARRQVDEGTVVAAGGPVFELIESDALEAWIGVPPTSAARLEIGSPIEVVIGKQTYQAAIQAIRPELDPDTRTRNVILRLEQPKDLVAGQVVRIGVREPVEVTGYWVPTSALSPGGRGLWSVLVAEPSGVAAARPVEVVENDGDRSFVRGALQAEEQVIVEGAHRVVAGQRVARQSASTTFENANGI